MLLLLLLMTCQLCFSLTDFWNARNAFIKEEENLSLGSLMVLSDKETIVNDILMKFKLEEYDAGFQNPKLFLPRRHFFEAKSDIEKSEVFKFLQKMPKGGALHGHDTALVSEEYLYNLTYEDNLYACTVDDRLKLKFHENSKIDDTCRWTLIKTLRAQNSKYDDWVRTQITLNVKNPREKYTDINVVWKAMSDIFATVTPMLTYKPIFQKHFYQSLQELYDDNVMYLEFRTTLPPLYELSGSGYDEEETVRVYRDTIEQFKADHPDFIGVKIIYGPRRSVDRETVKNYIKIVTDLQSKYGSLIAGFDLVGQEDLGRPLEDFIEELQKIPNNINKFFHAAETNWFGTSTDFNIIDAILLGTKRIGHGYGITKHPLVMENVKNKNIAIEICPISNQVLMLVEDMRNHPAAILIARGLPLVISYDDPTFWSTKGLSYDFYMAFMGFASRNSDLRLLKQFALNSLDYSALEGDEKKNALDAFEMKWNTFIDEVYELSGNGGYLMYLNWKLIIFILSTIILF